MKTALFLFTLPAVGALAGNPIPQAFAKERYAGMFAESPFRLATPLPGPAKGPPADPFANVYITSMSLDSDGRPVVYVKRPGDDRSTKLVGDATEPDSGLSIESVHWSKRLRDATVTAKHTSGITKVLNFSEAPPPVTGPNTIKSGIKKPNSIDQKRIRGPIINGPQAK